MQIVTSSNIAVYLCKYITVTNYWKKSEDKFKENKTEKEWNIIINKMKKAKDLNLESFVFLRMRSVSCTECISSLLELNDVGYYPFVKNIYLQDPEKRYVVPLNKEELEHEMEGDSEQITNFFKANMLTHYGNRPEVLKGITYLEFIRKYQVCATLSGVPKRCKLQGAPIYWKLLTHEERRELVEEESRGWEWNDMRRNISDLDNRIAKSKQNVKMKYMFKRSEPYVLNVMSQFETTQGQHYFFSRLMDFATWREQHQLL